MLRELTATDRPDVARGEPCVVAVAAGGGHELPACLNALATHTAPDVPVVLVGASGDDRRSALEVAGDRELWIAAGPSRARGSDDLTSTLDVVLGLLWPADVALLTEGCVVGAEWLTRLRAAAQADTNTATASALADRGGPLAIRNAAGSSSSPDELAAKVRLGSLALRPRLSRAVGPCVYIRREALELVGPLAVLPTLGEAVEIDFSERCVLRGLSHVAADDVVVSRPHDDPGDTAAPASGLRGRNPYLATPPETAASSVLPRALEAARRPQQRISVTVDGRALGTAITGTQIHIWQLTKALAATGELRLRVVVGPDTSTETIGLLQGLADTEVLALAQIDCSTPVTTVFHRPQQAFETPDLKLAFRLGQRLVVNQLDLIAYRNPGYFPGAAAWSSHRRVTRQTLAAADRIIVFSGHTRDEVLSDELADGERIRVVPPGVDTNTAVPASRPAALRLDADTDAARMLLCIGTDFCHKNRVFALRLLRALSERHGWRGRLVFAGTQIRDGSSRDDEREYLERHSDLTDRVSDLGPVSEGEKAWLLRNVDAVVYPTAYEGFGLVPFECARVGVPCLFAGQSSLAELPSAAATLVPWDEVLSADRAHPLLVPGEARDHHLAAIRGASEGLTWAAAAARTVEIYREAAVAPTQAAATLSRDESGREASLLRLMSDHNALTRRLVAEREHAQRMYDELNTAVGSGLSLVGPGGSLPEDVQRALLALDARPALRRALYAPVAGGFRIGRALRRRLRLDELDPVGTNPAEAPPTD